MISQRKVEGLVERTIAPLRDIVRAARNRSEALDRTAQVALADLEAAIAMGDVESAKEAKSRLMDALFELGVSLDE